jgi:2-succinyl-5-enolpyruvyl-6-hydroxy-3-cyclohexene-1-carboxylate synthase
MTNVGVASAILRDLWMVGVRDLVLCAGARNAPFVACLSSENSFRVHPFFEERSAGFFALGKMVATNRPVAVITTSGTAAAELLPAAIEADYQGQPLILVTADRPRHFRLSGAPQTINQVGLYSHYVEKSWDIAEDWTPGLSWSCRRPVHLNVCFDEPLIDAPIPDLIFRETSFDREIKRSSAVVQIPLARPLVLVSGLPHDQRSNVVQILKQWQRPVLLEAPSGLRGCPDLQDLEIMGGDQSLAAMNYDGVIRIGSVPTLRLWRDLEKSAKPVIHFSHLPFSGLPRSTRVNDLADLFTCQAEFGAWTAEERAHDRGWDQRRRQILKRFPRCEPAWIEWLSRQMPHHARVFIGNSLPIREWDFAAVRDGRREIFANRGVNGIDGLISTFMGLSQPAKSNWCVIGDLSAMYDLSGPWPNLREKIEDLNLVIVNNSGGKIFKRLFHNSLFENPHELNFNSWAEMWGWNYLRMTEPSDLPPSQGPRVIEVVPDDCTTEEFWRTWENDK